MSLGIRAQLFASFGVILVLLAGVAGLAVVQLQASEAATSGLTSQRFPSVEASLQIPEAVRTIQRDLRDSILLQDDAGGGPMVGQLRHRRDQTFDANRDLRFPW